MVIPKENHLAQHVVNDQWTVAAYLSNQVVKNAEESVNT